MRAVNDENKQTQPRSLYTQGQKKKKILFRLKIVTNVDFIITVILTEIDFSSIIV